MKMRKTDRDMLRLIASPDLCGAQARGLCALEMGQ